MPDPPYYAVIFTSLRSANNGEEYARLAERMAALASEQPGYLGMTSLRNEDGAGITISYWTDRAAIANWRSHAEHRLAQEQGRRSYYDEYRVEICLVEDGTSFTRVASGC